MAEFLELIEHNLKHGTNKQKAIARELLVRFLEGRLVTNGERK